MGIRVEFWEVPYKGIQEAITVDFEKMQLWYEAIADKYPDDVDSSILEILQQVNIAKPLFPQIQHELLDDFVSFYLGDYCDYGPGKRSAVTASMLNIRNYQKGVQLIKQKCSSEAQKLWAYLFLGRSLVEGKVFNIVDNEYRFCLFSEAECDLLLHELNRNFDISTAEKYNSIPAIGSVIKALEKKKPTGLLITAA